MKLEKKQGTAPEPFSGIDLPGSPAGTPQDMTGGKTSGVVPPMPEPRARGGSWGLSLLALLAVLAVGSAGYWLTRDDATRARWREEAASMVDKATSGTPLAGLGDSLRGAPPPPPINVTQPATAPNTLAGQQVQGSVPTPADLVAGQSGGAASGQDSFQQDGTQVGQSADALQSGPGAAGLPLGAHGLMPKVTEDSRIRPDIIEDMAAYLVSRYRHGSRGGRLAVSVQGMNSRYGLKMAQQDTGGRASLLRYAFHPAMLQGLYGLYVDRFMGALQHQAAAKNFTPEQTRGLHMALAGRLVIVAGAMESVASVPDLHQRFKDVEKKAQAVLDINMEVSNGVFELNQLRESKASETEIATRQLRIDGLGARYRRALEERDAAERALAQSLRKGGAPALDDSTLLYIAQWVDRRLSQGGEAAESVRSAASLLRDLARRCARTGAENPAQAVQPAAQQTTGTPQSTGQEATGAQ